MKIVYPSWNSKTATEVENTSLQTLEPGCELNDEIINFVFTKLRVEVLPKAEAAWGSKLYFPTFSFLSSFFYTKVVTHQNKKHNWFKEDTLSEDFVFIPVNEQLFHWTLLILDVNKKYLYLLDSLGLYSDEQDKKFSFS